MLNKTILQGFEWDLPADGTHWQTLQTKAQELQALGFNAIWLPPAYKGSSGINDVGYGVYDHYDLGEFQQKDTVPTKYGTKDEYLQAIQALQDHGLEVYADIVFNHLMGSDETEVVPAVQYSWDDRTEAISDTEEIEAWTKFTYPGRSGKYNDYVWTWKNFSGVDFDARSKSHAIYNFAGKGWDQEVDNEDGNYDYLMGCDLDMENEETIAQLEKWGSWYQSLTNVDGYRLDAVKHIQFDYYVDWLLNRRAEKGKSLFVVGEYWSEELDKLETYLNSSGNLIYLFDVPFHFRLFEAATSNGEFDMRQIFSNTLLETREDYAVTFVDNHDTQKGQSLESWIDGWFKVHAYALILLRKQGVPVVFWGDLYGIPAQGVEPVGDNLHALLKLRADTFFGNQVDYFDDPDCIGWVLTGDFEEETSGIAVVMTNGESAEKEMTISAIHRGKTFVDILGNNEAKVVLDNSGKGIFPVNAGQVSVYVQEASIK
uniref:alpha-amylase n=1 Tax=Candidatus Enterococcus willemsii TaxID=1857215 RepID=UPI00403F1BAD